MNKQEKILDEFINKESQGWFKRIFSKKTTIILTSLYVLIGAFIVFDIVDGGFIMKYISLSFLFGTPYGAAGFINMILTLILQQDMNEFAPWLYQIYFSLFIIALPYLYFSYKSFNPKNILIYLALNYVGYILFSVLTVGLFLLVITIFNLDFSYF
jgi:hypothetical protein